jgi:hypothetical protein
MPPVPAIARSAPDLIEDVAMPMTDEQRVEFSAFVNGLQPAWK